MKKSVLIFLLIVGVFCAYGQEPLLVNVYNRFSQSLDGDWNYIIDPYDNGFYNYRYEPFEEQEQPSRGAYFTNSKPIGPSDLIEYDFDLSGTLNVPGDWNTQNKELFYYEGTVWYKKSFDYVKSENDHRVFVYFGASNYETDVYLNGKKLGKHVGGFTPFNFEITNYLKEKGNYLIVKVNNQRKKEGVPTLNTDWWNYGGMTRGVKLIEVDEQFIEDYMVQLDPGNKKRITGYVKLNGGHVAGEKISLEIEELGIKQQIITDENGIASFQVNTNKIKYWSTDNPFLYEVKIRTEKDQLTDQIGFRSIETKGTAILLNGEKVFLKGISIHEESPNGLGRAHSKQDAVQLLTWAKELGCNYVRLAHYPHQEEMVRAADKMGILVWEENPVYWTIAWDNPETYQHAENQLSEVIKRDKNRASVIIWSMANETPTSPARNLFLGKLAKKTRSLDPTRLISAALEQSNDGDKVNVRTISDSFANVVDVLSFNQYIGWYDGLPEKCREISWNITQDKPVLISEFGAGAKYGLHGDKIQRWTEEYQEHLYVETLQMINKIDKIQGFSPWVLVDFRSPRRHLPNIQDGWNRKGLVSEKGEKKKAFYVLRKFYNSK